MYTILMTNYKELIATKRTTLYQRENLADKIQFLFPQTYGELNLADYHAVLKYLDQANIPHAEVLSLDENLYKEKLRYVLPVDTDLTKFAGDVTLRVSFIKTDLDNQQQVVLHTGEYTLTISPLADYYQFVPSESLEVLDQLIGKLDARLEGVSAMAETIDAEKADDIDYNGGEIQLMSNGKKIGTPAKITDLEAFDFSDSTGEETPDLPQSDKFEVFEF